MELKRVKKGVKIDLLTPTPQLISTVPMIILTVTHDRHKMAKSQQTSQETKYKSWMNSYMYFHCLSFHVVG